MSNLINDESNNGFLGHLALNCRAVRPQLVHVFNIIMFISSRNQILSESDIIQLFQQTGQLER